MTGIHRSADRGYAAGADTYVRGRPDYPPRIVGWLRDEAGLGPDRQVVDLGAGTGKFLPSLLATGARVNAVEPVASMRAALAAGHPDVSVLAGTAEASPLPDQSCDAVVCAQSFHWFANPVALAEIRRVLRPGGVLGLVWNVRDESVPWVAALTGMIDAYEGDTPRYRSGAWRALFPAAGFGPLSEQRFANSHPGPAEEVILDRTLSVSFIAALPAAEQARLRERVLDLIAATPLLAGRDEVAYPYETIALASRREG